MLDLVKDNNFLSLENAYELTYYMKMHIQRALFQVVLLLERF